MLGCLLLGLGGGSDLAPCLDDLAFETSEVGDEFDLGIAEVAIVHGLEVVADLADGMVESADLSHALAVDVEFPAARPAEGGHPVRGHWSHPFGRHFMLSIA